MATIKIVKCPESGKTMKVQAPTKPGSIVFDCPFCGKKHQVVFTEEDIAKANAASEVKIIEFTGVVGEEQNDKCPTCGKEIVYTRNEGGIYDFECPHCHQKLRKSFVVKTEHGNKKTMDRAKLVLVKKGLVGMRRKEVFTLHEGQNIVGRYDNGANSDISIKGDDTMSRRSIAIDVIRQDKGYLYKMRVLRSLNPVYVNDNVLMVDESRYLNFGDRIVLGKTMLTFEKKED
ncbi:MAG: FHA domain-containing protein [Bacteroidales bacterium]|nr:FHA domain-containing protein [Bacteroidales bacterium]